MWVRWIEMAYVTLFVGASLRKLHPELETGETRIEIRHAMTVAELLAEAGVPVERARVLLLNHRKAFLDSLVRPGDRLAVFPPELAFNMYVALELAHAGRREGSHEPGPNQGTRHDDPGSSQ
jgi:sulfur carrier protein ThiS